MMTERPLTRARLSDQIEERLRDELRAGTIVQGERLTELNIAARYGASRTPVREALIQLHRDGLIDGGERGFRVPLPSRRDMLDRLEVRELLDRRIAAHVARISTNDEIEELRLLLADQEGSCEDVEPEAFVAANLAFRRRLRALCGNPVLERTAAMVDDQFQVMRGALQRLPAVRRMTLRHNRAILDAIAARDAAGAEDAVSGFVEELRRQSAGDRATGID
jgi:DNA-binding GntR family transcriptional regulator